MPYHSIEDPAKLRRVLEATLLLEADLDLPTLLRHIVDEARSMTNARYGALGVLNEEGSALSEFITVGLEPDEEARIGDRPTGRGVLGLLITRSRPLRVARLQAPPGELRIPSQSPTDDLVPRGPDQGAGRGLRQPVPHRQDRLVGVHQRRRGTDRRLALGAAGIAIENARLHSRVQEVAIYEERDRLARDLHDTVIQRLFAIGLSLQSMAASPSAATHHGSADARPSRTSMTPSARSGPASSSSDPIGQRQGVRDRSSLS